MIRLSSIKDDLAKQREGDWVTFRGNWPEPVQFKVRSTESPAFKMAFEKLLVALRQKHGDEPTPPDELQSKLGALYAEHLLLDWQGLDEPYTPELALQVLTDPAYREVTNAIHWCATRVGQAKIQLIEAAAKN